MPQLFTNNARALLASGIDNVVTSLTVEAAKADLFPTANTGTGSVPSVNNWFKATLQDSAGNVEIIYVRTRTAGSAVFSNVLRGQEGTTARAFVAGSVVGLRITAADVEGSIAAANNSVQLTGNQTIAGTKTFSSPIVGDLTGNVTGNVSGNAGTVTDGVYISGSQTITGSKTFSGSTTMTGGLTVSNVAPLITLVETDQAAPAGRRRLVQDGNQFTLRRNTAAAGDFTTEVNDITSDASGNFTASGNVTAFSDERLKKDWDHVPNLVDNIANVRMGTYTRIDTGERQVGVSAQSLELVLPEAVMEDSAGMKSVAYGNAALAACVALAREVQQLRARLAALEAK